ncbi:pyrimidine-nucleoside phosphorylase [Facklamia miroungae]|uniref:Pyrimidine-nucleoside phosphorylase n=1 Tax=Facklamia miroungae TaxID=120956 RepID=A0A1G7RGR4_9LACT|nr:pyrimidine-nucleoside phosphorylase [Facklamia miroungae]NKZ29419.1 pyrimidine-nucleoside phosphorylase [Facklamia miroungae]SDG09952.1 pyrimidine-nucleoside phosphorylase [Facklamia miroungae]
MRMVDLIHKKQENQTLTQEEIQYIVKGFTEGKIPDYQMAAFNMAVYFNGMNPKEVSALTMAMVESGDQIDLSAIKGIKVDKHSTGGVGDTTTLVLAPLVASCGVPVAKMSGRGLGHTGGTIDKLETIKGFQFELSQEDFIQQVNQHQVAVVGQTGDLTPADKKLYALRDVTSTVQSIPLIASSIMSKKIASGADAIVLDVKVGDGAFMKTIEMAEELATTMVEIGNHLGRKTVAVLSNMDQPLGFAIGNTLEVNEAVETLKGNGPEDLTQLCLSLGAQMLLSAQRVKSIQEGTDLLQEQIDSGAALKKFREFIEVQGGDASFIDEPERLGKAKYQIPYLAKSSGVVSHWVANLVGEAAMVLGAGRAVKEDQIDPVVGIVLKAKVGDSIQEGEPLAIIHSNREDISDCLARLDQAVQIADSAEELPLIYKTID